MEFDHEIHPTAIVHSNAKLAENINDQNIHLQKLTSDNLRLSRLVDTNQNKILELIASSKEILLTFQTSLQEKDDEINRLKIGYDFKIQKDLLNQQFYQLLVITSQNVQENFQLTSS